MSQGKHRRRWHPDTLAVALLGATFLVVTILLGQALLTLRSHELTVEATLEDFAGFASERIAGELNSTFASIFLDQIAAGRTAHYAWVDRQGEGDALPTGRWLVPEGAIPLHFSIEGDRVITRGGVLDAETEAWIVEIVGAHARDVYPRPAPYAVLRSNGPDGQRTVVYRREQAYERVSIYGFLVRFEAFGPVYAEILDDTPVLPRSLAGEADAEELLTVSLVFPQGEEVLFTRPGPNAPEPVLAEAFAAKAGRMAVRVELDAERARALVPGGYPGGRIPFFVALVVLTLGLFAVALALVRRAARLTRMRETFVANVSHDLRTPLAQIRMFSETLLLGRITEPTERRRSLEIIQEQATNLSDLVDNILHASSRERGRLRPSPTGLEKVLGNTLDALGPSASSTRARLHGRVDGSTEAVVDAGALRRILINLIDNALKYGPAGQDVTVRLENRDDFLDVVVEDQGPGVPRRERARVWERFSRLEHEGRAITGTGIGLAVVRDLAERHGGEVRFEEAVQGGARVTVTLATGGAVA